jgi:hypothetical protein
MKNRFGGVVAGQIIGLIIVCSISGFLALTTFGAVGGVSMAAYPEPTFKLFEPVLCDSNTELRYREEFYGYHRPGEAAPFVECVQADGTVVKDVTGAAIIVSLIGSFLACFLPLCIPGGLLALILPPILIRRKKEKQPNQPAPNLID